MKEYFYNNFPSQLSQLNLIQPNNIVREHIMQDQTVMFFGGPEWEKVSEDLLNIPENDRASFILSLLMIVLTDQCLYTYNHDLYSEWRRKTNFPKFGWAGFGAHNENPLKILWAPEREHYIECNRINELLPSFVKFLIEETQSYFNTPPHTLNIPEFFKHMRQDEAFNFDQGRNVQQFKKELDAELKQYS